jgi:hypothetical protein
VAAENDAALEAEEEVLADGVDALEHPAVDRARDAGRLAPRVRALRLYPVSDERADSRRSAVDRISLGHFESVETRERSGRATAGRL